MARVEVAQRCADGNRLSYLDGRGTGSYVVRSPPACATLTTPRPATGPANTTVPAPAERTICPARSVRTHPVPDAP